MSAWWHDYFKHRASLSFELKALNWTEVDIDRGIVSVRVAWDRSTDEVK